MRAEPDMVTMTDAQVRIIDRMDEELGYPFRDIASDTRVPEPEVRRVIRRFHDAGWAEFGTLYNQDEAKVAGRGYWLNGRGSDLKYAVRRHVGWAVLWPLASTLNAGGCE